MKHQAIVAALVMLAATIGGSGCKRAKAQTAPRAEALASAPAQHIAQRAIGQQQAAYAAAQERMRFDYVARVQRELDQMNAQVTPLAAAASRATGAARAEDQRLLGDVNARRAALHADLAAIPHATSQTWPAVKAKVDKDLTAFEGAMRTTSSRIHAPPPRATAPSPRAPTKTE